LTAARAAETSLVRQLPARSLAARSIATFTSRSRAMSASWFVDLLVYLIAQKKEEKKNENENEKIGKVY